MLIIYDIYSSHQQNMYSQILKYTLTSFISIFSSIIRGSISEAISEAISGAISGSISGSTSGSISGFNFGFGSGSVLRDFLALDPLLSRRFLDLCLLRDLPRDNFLFFLGETVICVSTLSLLR